MITSYVERVMEIAIGNGFSLAIPPRKRQVRFSARHDIILLREVIAQNPFSTKDSSVRLWARIAEIITASMQDEYFEVDARRCRERTLLLLDYYKKQDFFRLRRSGTEALYAEKEDLLHEVMDLEARKSSQKTPRVQEASELVRKAAPEDLFLPEQDKPDVTALGIIASREDATQPSSPASSIRAESEGDAPAEEPGPVVHSSRHSCQCCCHHSFSEALRFLEKRTEAEHQIREEELALRREELEVQRSKICLERERLEEERKERERRFRLESQERQVILDLLKEKILKG
ncbi:uncharacterized protein si:dkey-45d16.4 isoform X1 [Gadus morhua]|uniref:uncharacterized protein si:dkey-45d16.4 isoform X1 n=2 Tax=Gadus morhua TaxID=8049 RepID=UPI0011B47E30|nr:uncharacterized protein LOC115541004 isoform X1 [Gadus morhua]